MPYPGPETYPGPGLYPMAAEPDGYEMQTIVGQELADQLYWSPYAAFDWWYWYLDAIGALFQQTAAIATDIGVDGDQDYQTGYGSIFTINPRFPGDTAICPTDQLPFVSQPKTLPPPASSADLRV
jgi:hypothetical protein